MSILKQTKPYSAKGQLLADLFAKRILFLDGAMGTMIQQHKLSENDFRNDSFADVKGDLKGNNDLLSITRPDIIEDIHRAFFEAGADMVETNTFSGTTIAQADYEMESIAYEINYAGARLAREALRLGEDVEQPPRLRGHPRAQPPRLAARRAPPQMRHNAETAAPPPPPMSQSKDRTAHTS